MYDILLIFKEYLVLAACIIVSSALFSLNDTPQIRDLRSAAVVVVGYVQDVFSFIPNYFSLQEENRVLRERNVSLAAEVSLLRESRLENIRLRNLLQLKQRLPFTYLAAEVVGKNQQPMRNTITLDVGKEDGVKYNMPIVTDAGLVGRIIATGGGYSIGQIMLHKDFRASVQVEGERVDGILYWSGKEYLLVKNIPRTAKVEVGDVIITSNVSTIYPAGIKVGVVSKAERVPGELFYTIHVAPAADFSRLEEVFVITQSPDSSRLALEQRFK